MLDAFIIEELKRREKQQHDDERPVLHVPEAEEPIPPPLPNDEKTPTQNIVIDL
tara:strand:- start:209 stop:370 length:162 start_codon:yes stop_codon:yes gene_type:complete